MKNVLVGGPKLRVAKAQESFVKLADACGYPVMLSTNFSKLLSGERPLCFFIIFVFI